MTILLMKRAMINRLNNHMRLFVSKHESCKMAFLYLFFICGVFIAPPSWANLSVATISARLMEPTKLFANAITAISGVIGIGLLVASVMQYMDHRRSPTMVRLSTPIIFSILGMVLTVLPVIAEYSAGAGFLAKNYKESYFT
jgi:hypothetical protein